MDKHTEFEKEKVKTLVFKYTVPSMVAMMAGALYNIVDRIFVGRGVGVSALSGVALTFPLMVILTAFTILFAVGTAVMVSLKLGEKKNEDAEKIIGTGYLLSIISGIVLSVIIYISMRPILAAFGGSGSDLEYAVQFMQVVLFSTVFQMMGYTLNHSIRAVGFPIIALITIVAGAVLNTILNPVFIFVLHLGIRGSALATVISQILTAIWTLAFLTNKKIKINLKFINIRYHGDFAKSIIKIGLPALFLQGLMSITLTVANIVFSKYAGSNGLAVISIIGVIYTLFHMTITGINQGITPIIGYNYGAKKISRVKQTVKISMIFASVISIVGFIIIFFFNKPIMLLFSSKDNFLLTTGATALKYTFIAVPFFGFAMITGGYFLGIGNYKMAIVINALRISLLTVPLLLILPKFFGFWGCIAAFPVTDTIASIIIAFIFILDWKKPDIAPSAEYELQYAK